MIEDNFVDTGVDLAFKLVLMNERMPVSTIARVLDLKTEYVERLLDILERKKMLRMNYKLFREPEVMINRWREEVPGMKRMKIFDWVIHCPMEETGVMFKSSCLNCNHFKDVEGKIMNRKGEFDFRPENVVCSWKGKPDAM